MFENFERANKEVTENDIINIVHSMKKNFLFYDLGENEYITVIK